MLVNDGQVLVKIKIKKRLTIYPKNRLGEREEKRKRRFSNKTVKKENKN